MQELGIRKPNYMLGATGTFAEQLATIVEHLEDIILDEQPDAFLVLGDTNSSLGAIVAKRLGVRVFHMEAGNRCYDDRVPEEVNRRIIDHSSDILMPYTERSRQNLLAEGIHSNRIYVTGNPILEVINYNSEQIANKRNREGDYFLVTLHRQENVDDPERLAKFVEAFREIGQRYEMPLMWSVHPRTAKQLQGWNLPKSLEVHEPFGFHEFIALEQNATCVLTDSGTVQEECAIFGVPVVTLRDTTERPETLESGSNFISGCEPHKILQGIDTVLRGHTCGVPLEYLEEHVSDKVVKLVTGFWK